MTFRRRLPLCVVAWLTFQLSSVSFFVPRACCAAHEAVPHEALADCHRTAAATSSYCPMRAADGTPCPMHRQAPPKTAPGDDCAMSSACNAPAVSLAALLWDHGVVAVAIDAPRHANVDRLVALVPTNLVSRFTSPDTPPPRLSI